VINVPVVVIGLPRLKREKDAHDKTCQQLPAKDPHDATVIKHRCPRSQQALLSVAWKLGAPRRLWLSRIARLWGPVQVGADHADDPFEAQVNRAEITSETSTGGTRQAVLPQAMLGFLPDAPRNKLLLPEWLPDLTIRDLRLGKHKFDIRFWRDGERTEFEVLSGNASLVVRCEVGNRTAELLAHV
jgi:hypothetical protein